MRQLKVVFKNSQDALLFCDLARQSGLYLWDIDSVEREILLNYSKPLPFKIKNTKTWYYDTDAEAEFMPWVNWMILQGYELKIKTIGGTAKSS